MSSHTTPYQKVKIAAEREEVSEEAIMFKSLSEVSYQDLQREAGEAGVYPAVTPSSSRLRRIMAEAGFFYGDVGDDTLYRRLDGETVVIQEG